MQSLAYGFRLKYRALGCGVCIFTYPGGTPSVSEHWLLSLSSGGPSGVLGHDGAGSGGGAPVPLRLQVVWGLCAVPFWQARQLSVWFSRIIDGCLFISAVTVLCPGNTTPRFFSSRTPAHGLLISCCLYSITVRENPSLAILAISKATCMSDCSSCTRPPCVAIVADMFKTYKKLVAASRVRIVCYLNHIQIRSLLQGLETLFCSFLGPFIANFICENPRTDSILIFNFADFAGKCLGRPWSCPLTGSDELVTSISNYPSCVLYCLLTVINIDIDWVTSDRMLLCILAASGLTYYSQMCVLGHIFGGYNCSVAVN